MKQFRKNSKGFFICEECRKIFKTKKNLGVHIGMVHNQKEYYDNWLKELGDNICKICGKKTKFYKLSRGYNLTCSSKCTFKCRGKNITKEVVEKRKQTSLKKYKVDNPSKSKEIKEKIKQIYSLRTKEEKEQILRKRKNTCIKKYGVENSYQAEICKEKIKQTLLKNYKVKHPLQNKKIFEKQQKSALKIQKFKNTNLYYQGSYELDFLEKYYDRFPNIQRAPSIKYIFQGKNKIYFPDFYIPSLKLIIECKNSYLAKMDKDEIYAKKKATIDNSFKYIMLVDKNYDNLFI